MASSALHTICLFGIIVTVSVWTAGGTCPEGFQTHNQECYKFMFINATWIHALKLCQAIGSRLLSIESHDEQNYIMGRMMSLNVNSFAKPNRYWIGGTDLEESRTFRWTFSGSQITFSHWDRVESFNRDGIERCMDMYSDYHWNDVVCNQNRNFIWETSAS